MRSKKLLACFMAVVLGVSLMPVAPAEANDTATVQVPGLGGEPGRGGSIPIEAPVKSIHDANEPRSMQPLDALPSSYSSVDEGNVSPVRDQGVFGTCWTFAAIGAIESSLLAHGQVDSVDLSERHLAYFTYNSVADPLGNTVGDKTVATGGSFGGADYLGNGGNSWIASNIFATWQGAVNEDAVGTYAELLQTYSAGNPYDKFLEMTALDDSAAYALDSWHLKSSQRIDLSDRDDVKRAIVDHGAAVVQIGFGSYSWEDYMNFNTGGYYYTGNDINHDVLLVGWDDNFSASNFGGPSGEGPSPSSDGAWLVRNSWGSSWGSNWNGGGYFWMSYEDMSMGDKGSGMAIVYDAEAASLYDNIYQYDGSAGSCYNYVDSGGSIASMFTAKANAGGVEKVSAVSFALSDVNVDYSVQVYSNVSGSTDPTAGTPMLATPVTGKTSYVGFYKVALPTPVTVAEGSKYSVVVTLSHSDGSMVGYDVDAPWEQSWGVRYDSAVAAGQSFECDRAGASWDDLALKSSDTFDEAECCARVKAYTTNAAAPTVKPAASKKSQTIKAAKTYTVKASALKKKAQKVAVKFKASGGGKVTWKAARKGKMSIAKNGKATVKKGAKKGTYSLKVNCTAAAKGNYKKTTKKVNLTVKVK